MSYRRLSGEAGGLLTANSVSTPDELDKLVQLVDVDDC
jgi:hypothetical protein